MRFAIRVPGVEVLAVDLTDDEPEDKARDLSGGSLGSEALPVSRTGFGLPDEEDRA